MPNNNGLIYRTSSKGVSILADIQHVLGETTNEAGALCRSDRINKNALYKPIDYPAGFLPDSQRGAIVTYQGHTMCHGLIVPRYQGTALFKSAVDNGDVNNFYTYVRPSSWLRPLDFVPETPSTTRGYDHNAKPPVDGVQTATSQEYFTIRLNTNVQTDNQIKLFDLVPDGDAGRRLSDYYLGALLVNKSNPTVIDQTYVNSSPCSSQDTITIPQSRFTNGVTYVIYPFFSSTNDINTLMWLVPIEGVGTVEYTKGDYYTVQTNASWIDTDKTIAAINYMIKSNMSNLHRICRIEIWDITDPSNKHRVTYIGTKNFEFTLNVNETYPSSGRKETWTVSNLTGRSRSYQFYFYIGDDLKIVNIMSANL